MIEKVIDNLIETMEGDFSIILKDLGKSRVLYEKNPGRQIPSASTIKILIMIEAYRKFLLGKLNPDERVMVKNDEKVEFSLISEMSAEEYKVKDLILLMMSISDNTAANVLIDILGMDDINSTGEALGLKGTVLQRKMMDFEAARRGKQNLTEPGDIIMIFEKLYRNELLTAAACNEMLKTMSVVVGRDFMIRDLPPDIRCAHKTGELDGINHDAGIIYAPSCDYALGIFATSLKDNVFGRNYIAQLSKEVFDHIYRLGGIE